jgi:RNA polymerase sigma-70 factor, ECF subfamily
VQDVAAFETFYVAHRRHVVAYCLRRASRTDALEAADETFLIAWRRSDEIPPQERAWLYGVAYRVLANLNRGERRRRQLTLKLTRDPREVVADPEAELIRSQDQERLRAALERLRPEEQEVLRLAVWEDRPHEEVAVALDCETAAARQRLHRARERLAAEVGRSERRALTLARRRSHD